MAVINNTASEIGDVILMKATVPVVGLTSITGFVESISGETASRLWGREFHYSLDGLNYNDYVPLTIANLNAVPVQPNDLFFIEYRYTRTGTDISGVLEFNYTEIQGLYSMNPVSITFEESVFSEFFDSPFDPDILNWCLNVLDKMYRPGIVPISLTRGDECNMNGEDDDYIDFWRSISCFWAMIVAYARRFETFYNDRNLLSEFLIQRGMFICPNQSLVDLQYLMNNYYDEMRQRGTYMTSIPKGDLVNGVEKPVDGEILRMFCYNEKCDEFLFANSEFDKIGTVLGCWSPMYMGAMPNHQLVKGYEQSVYVEDLSKYPLINGGNISIENDPIAGGNVMRIDDLGDGNRVGFGAEMISAPPFDKGFNVDPQLTYEFSFRFRANIDAPYRVALYGMDENGVPNQLQSVNNSVFSTSSIANMEVDPVVSRDDTYYFFRTIIHPSTYTYSPSETAGFGDMGKRTSRNFKMNSNICRILPEFVLFNFTGGAVGSIRIFDIRFGLAATEYSTGFINEPSLVQMFAKNNAARYSQSQLENLIKFYMLPLDSSLKLNLL